MTSYILIETDVAAPFLLRRELIFETDVTAVPGKGKAATLS